MSEDHDDPGITGGVEDDEASGGVSGDHDDQNIDSQEGMEDGEA